MFQERCGELLQDFVKEKNKAVCSLCSESCTEVEKTHKALRALIEGMVIEAVEGCSDKKDIFVCALCPYLSTLNLFKSYCQGKYAKRLTKEMEKSTDRLLAIIRSANERKI